MSAYTIWKFCLSGADCSLEMPVGARLLGVDTQPDDIPGRERVCLWAVVNADARMVARRIVTRPTGKTIPVEQTAWPYIDTFFMGDNDEIVYHAFDGGESALVQADANFAPPKEQE